MSSNAVTNRGGKAGMAPPGHRFQSNENNNTVVNEAVNSCIQQSSNCCLGSLETGGPSVDDKYSKRSHQNKQKRLRDGFLLLFLSLCLLGYTAHKTRGDEMGRFKRASELYHTSIDRGRGSRSGDEGNDDDESDGDDTEEAGDDRREQRRERPRLLNDDRGHPERRAILDRVRGRGGRGRPLKRGKKRRRWEREAERESEDEERDSAATMERRLLELEELNTRIESNSNTTIRWADMKDVPSLPGRPDKFRSSLIFDPDHPRKNSNHMAANGKKTPGNKKFFQVHRPESMQMEWEKDFESIGDKDATARDDYVNYVEHNYEYPTKLMKPPARLGDYPRLHTYKEIMDTWPQDDLDNPPSVLKEDLIHFDWNDPADMTAAVKFREAKLPFKVVNVPELLAAGRKWTDEYIAKQFDATFGGNGPQASGRASEGPDNFFPFFNPALWNVEELGLPPTRDNDWTFGRWARHSNYADRVGLNSNLPHYYWQSGVSPDERHKDRSKWTFISRDLPSFSTTGENFVVFHQEHQKGIQCRFGERGITAANHYDSGRNMIGMITGAKRYILSPPRACKKLGIVSSKGHSSFRHSMLNYGHMSLLDGDDDSDMPPEEREWMEMAGSADALSTVLKEGEILYVPTGWFHYITSLQKSAQCNVRSGPDMTGDAVFGGGDDIRENCFPHQ